MRLGDAFILLAEEPRRHLWIVISDPTLNPEAVLFVSVTTFTPTKDGTCQLDVGDHPNIEHLSCVAYRDIRQEPLSRLETLKRNGGLVEREPVSDVVLDRILDGARDSEFTRIGKRQILRDQNLI